MVVKNERFFEVFDELGGYKKGSLKLKKPKELQVRLLSIYIHDRLLIIV